MCEILEDSSINSCINRLTVVRSRLVILHTDQGASRDKDQLSDNVGLGWNWTLTNTLNYKFNVAKLHHFDTLVGMEYYKSRPDYGDSVNATVNGTIFKDFAHAYPSLAGEKLEEPSARIIAVNIYFSSKS